MRMDIKMEKMSQKALERKSNKPIMEKKRRARINHCLNQLKSLILEADNERSRHSKLEKADILEMTVKYLQTLRTYHVQLQQIHQLQQQQQSSQQQLHHHFQQATLGNSKQQQAAQLSPAQSLTSEPGTPPINLQLPQLSLPLPLQLSLAAASVGQQQPLNLLDPQSSPEVSPKQQHHQRNHHHHHHRHHHNQALQQAHQNHLSHHHHHHHHMAQQISPTWRPW